MARNYAPVCLTFLEPSVQEIPVLLYYIAAITASKGTSLRMLSLFINDCRSLRSLSLSHGLN